MARRAALVGAAVAALIVALALPAGAHALLASSEPASGARLDRTPGAVSITFTEPPDPKLSAIRVLGTDGRAYERGAPRASGKTLRMAVSPLAEGVYTVTWRVISRVDGHLTGGAFAFGVGVSPTGVTLSAADIPTTPSPRPFAVAGRWAFLTGLVVLVGGAGIAMFVLEAPSRPVLRLVLGGWLLAAGGLVALGASQRSEAGVPLGTLLGTSVGRALLWRAVPLAVAGAAAIVALSELGPARRRALGVVVAGALGSIAAHTSAGHAGAASLPALSVIVQWAHVAAVGVWIGGLGALVLGTRGAPSDAKARAVRRFSTAAGWGLVVVAGTGLFRALGEVGSWGQLASTAFGRVVLIKVGVIGALAALGAVNRYRNVPAATRSLRGLRRVSSGELGFALVALVSAALLASLTPGRSVQAAAARIEQQALVVSGSDFATTLRARLEVAPGDPGPNRFTLRLTDFDTGTPVDAARVSMRFALVGATETQTVLELERVSPGTWRADAASLALPGRWRARVLVQRGGDSTEVVLEVATRCRTTVTPGDPTLYTLDLPGIGSAQGYVDPGTGGPNEVHMTYFDTAGNELRLGDDVTMLGVSSRDEEAGLRVRRFGPGHFIADARLTAGEWRFDVAATAPGGQTLRACFEHGIQGRKS